MTVQELIDALAELDPDAEVRLAAQPSWPLEHYLGEPVAVAGSNVRPARVYLTEGRQIGYLDGAAAVAIGWRDEDDR